MRKTIEQITDFFWTCVRRLRRKSKVIRLKNPNASIISNNCVGCVITHDLGQQFRSPTVNLWMENDDFFEFLSHLEYYANQIPEEIQKEGIPYPVGVLRRGETEVVLYFTHYGSFESAREQWIRRAKRVDFDNLYIIFDHPQTVTSEDPDYLRFQALPYPNKVMLTSYRSQGINDSNVVFLHAYDSNLYPGKVLDYTNKYTRRRHLDEFDYVSFLNQKR